MDAMVEKVTLILQSCIIARHIVKTKCARRNFWSNKHDETEKLTMFWWRFRKQRQLYISLSVWPHYFRYFWNGFNVTARRSVKYRDCDIGILNGWDSHKWTNSLCRADIVDEFLLTCVLYTIDSRKSFIVSQSFSLSSDYNLYALSFSLVSLSLSLVSLFLPLSLSISAPPLFSCMCPSLERIKIATSKSHGWHITQEIYLHSKL